MGVFDFGSSEPKVTQIDFDRHIATDLRDKGFTHEEVDTVRDLFAEDMRGTQYVHGMTREKLAARMQELRAHPDARLFHADPHKLDELEQAFTARLA
ncbi:hypothetical protein KGQ55_03185 [Patescibacteria group bacterium]|nr:hypothetical protein [Patescibacteria group bacterium]